MSSWIPAFAGMTHFAVMNVAVHSSVFQEPAKDQNGEVASGQIAVESVEWEGSEGYSLLE